jgi:NAD(P)-dependent dehydrogenase (short-subunit alcohol dehydrogenase family)
MASILVTGSSRGIGRATALTLGRAGHTVHATMRNPAAATSLAETIAEEGLAVHLSAMDVTIDSSVADGISAIEAAHGPLDALVNNAGIEYHGSIEELPLADIRAIMETNCIQAVMPSMRARRRGCIVNVTSVAGRISSSPLGAYAASKFALEAASEALAQEAAMFGVRVAILQPGIINTEMAQAITTEHDTSPYPHARRFGGLFAASLQHPTSPMLVAETIREIVEGDTGRLRHPVGPDAEPFLAWRAAMTDEEWVAWGAAQDEEWYASVERDFGLNARRV